MLKLALRGVRYNGGRYVATLIAIITGVAFFTAAGFLSDRVIDALEGDVNRQFAGVEAAVVADDDGAGSTSPTTSASAATSLIRSRRSPKSTESPVT